MSLHAALVALFLLQAGAALAEGEGTAPPPEIDAEAIENDKLRALIEDIDALHETVGAASLSKKALELLSAPPPEPMADLTILLFAEADVWSVRYAEHEGLAAPAGEVVLPEGATVELRPTAADLVYEMSFPDLGLSFDALPGRIGVVRFETAKAGLFTGECRICGAKGAPLTLRVAPRAEFESWLSRARTK